MGYFIQADADCDSERTPDTHTRFRGLSGGGLRYYIPGIGRWASRDPIGERGGLHVYAFCANSAVGRVDRHGESWKQWVAKALIFYSTLFDDSDDDDDDPTLPTDPPGIEIVVTITNKPTNLEVPLGEYCLDTPPLVTTKQIGNTVGVGVGVAGRAV